jgi:hypothetical protein
MDLFSAAGVELGAGNGRSGRPAVPRSLRVPLLNYKVIREELTRVHFDATEDQLKVAAAYAKKARNPRFAKEKETAVRNLFFDDVLCKVLGYTTFDPDRSYSLAFERPIRHGAVDVALGRFPNDAGKDEIVAPFEMKGPATHDLDAIMPGRGRSPVQQAWDYAIDAPGSRWVLVSNCTEIRLYAFGRGRDAYEMFDLTRLDDRDELERLWLILSADRLLGGATDKLLRDTDSAYKDITGKLYVEYRDLRERLISFLTDSADGPKLAPAAAIETAQKLLDRILFVAFAERTDLLPDRLLERAVRARNEFVPEPLWRNFHNLFRSIDTGNDALAIWAYNGGLFAPDPIADTIAVPDPLATDLAGLGNWDYRSEVPVTVLGHIFEQSITDLEKLRAQRLGHEEPKVSKRKREGVVYTPDVVTRFLAERTIGITLDERRDTLLAKYGKPSAKRANGDIIFADSEKDKERAFWSDYAAALRDLTIVDPACGSGAFLVAAFDLLAREYRAVVNHLADLGVPVDFDPFDEIVTRNLYGVDLNAESVEITRLALWLKTARSKHRLQNLEATIRTGNSLITDKAYTDRPFDWRAAFPEVFARGGFDVVIGNPPYVRMELIKPFKPYLEKEYVVAADRADLYAYFFERGVGLLKEGGRLGYISSSTFFRTGSGENLRTFLGDRVAIETVIDFGDLQLFEGVTTYPAIVTLRKGGDAAGSLSFLTVTDALPNDLSAAFEDRAVAMPRARLTSGSWRFENDALARLRDKIVTGRKTLGEVYGAPLYGIKTGLNDAFIIDRKTRDRLVKQDKNSVKLLKPFLRGENIKRWRVESEDLFLINTPKGKVDIDNYPAIRDWLLPFKAGLEKRATKQDWFELQQAQLAYQPSFATPKIIYGHFAQDRIFAFDDGAFLSNDKSYIVPNAKHDLLAFLNSKVSWDFITSVSPAVRGGFHEMRVQYIEKVPLPNLDMEARKLLTELGQCCSSAAKRRLGVQRSVSHRIADLSNETDLIKLGRKLETWWQLDFNQFRTQITRAFKSDIPIKERDQWEQYLADNAREVKRLTSEIEAAEHEIDATVYKLFDLTADEIRLLEESLAGQY